MTTTEEIKIGGNKKAYLVKRDGAPIGTISQYRQGDVWVVCRGVGNASTPAGNAKTKKDAVALLANN
jgi:hypothetical protein